MYFRNYRLWKRWWDKRLKSPVSKHPSTVIMLKYSKHCWNLQHNTFIIFSLSLWGKLSLEVSLILIFEILGMFGNTLIATDKNSLFNLGNLWQEFQMEVSEKVKAFSEFFTLFLNIFQILNILKKKVTLVACIFLKLKNAKDMVI